jgi:osmotically-inducible protein OsmY
MLKKSILIAAPFLFAFGACKDYDRADRVNTTEERARAAETVDRPILRDDVDNDRGTGMFDRDADDVDEDNIIIPEESARVGLSDQQVVERFRADIKSDPDLAKENVSLSVRGGKLVLEGTVSTEDVGEAIEEYAEELADDRDVDNRLKSPMDEDEALKEP